MGRLGYRKESNSVSSHPEESFQLVVLTRKATLWTSKHKRHLLELGTSHEQILGVFELVRWYGEVDGGTRCGQKTAVEHLNSFFESYQTFVWALRLL
ncbi:hypothetical protein M413DRAFT_376258 [Hebeloma cylindrosporum]|uniref:Uncharacterized protein n=1 Tax=Hebeloma cylindrosporum TaxID=76867 RepID=A0A0C3C5Q6_HEBCY|nr:hypothetical protein M413DRAFT_376258 [Hebeloma cylindrosporum h7]